MSDTKVVPTREELLGAIARGWCHPENSSKGMDSDLASAICEEIMKFSAAPSPAEATGYDAGVRAGIEAAAKVCESYAVEINGKAYAGGAMYGVNGKTLAETLRALPAAQVAAQSLREVGV